MSMETARRKRGDYPVRTKDKRERAPKSEPKIGTAHRYGVALWRIGNTVYERKHGVLRRVGHVAGDAVVRKPRVRDGVSPRQKRRARIAATKKRMGWT